MGWRIYPFERAATRHLDELCLYRFAQRSSPPGTLFVRDKTGSLDMADGWDIAWTAAIPPLSAIGGPVYSGLKKMGGNITIWMRCSSPYEGYNSKYAHFNQKKVDKARAFRS